MELCVLPAGAKINNIVAVSKIQNWRNDSLYIYIDDDDAFYQEYSKIFDCGTYANLPRGVVDILGVNYYAPEYIDPIIEKIRTEKPIDYETLVDWLNTAKKYNGFYILGI